MHLDRARQREILETLTKVYPSYASEFVRADHELEDMAILWYLRKHELIEASLDQTLSGDLVFAGAKITAKGLDFLADDGGLSAILGTVTVKLHADTIRELILARIDQSPMSAEKKSWLRKSVETMTTEALKAMAKSLIEKGLEHAPDLMELAARWAPQSGHS